MNQVPLPPRANSILISSLRILQTNAIRSPRILETQLFNARNDVRTRVLGYITWLQLNHLLDTISLLWLLLNLSLVTMEEAWSTLSVIFTFSGSKSQSTTMGMHSAPAIATRIALQEGYCMSSLPQDCCLSLDGV